MELSGTRWTNIQFFNYDFNYSARMKITGFIQNHPLLSVDKHLENENFLKYNFVIFEGAEAAKLEKNPHAKEDVPLLICHSLGIK